MASPQDFTLEEMLVFVQAKPALLPRFKDEILACPMDLDQLKMLYDKFPELQPDLIPLIIACPMPLERLIALYQSFVGFEQQNAVASRLVSEPMSMEEMENIFAQFPELQERFAVKMLLHVTDVLLALQQQKQEAVLHEQETEGLVTTAKEMLRQRRELIETLKAQLVAAEGEIPGDEQRVKDAQKAKKNAAALARKITGSMTGLNDRQMALRQQFPQAAEEADQTSFARSLESLMARTAPVVEVKEEGLPATRVEQAEPSALSAETAPEPAAAPVELPASNEELRQRRTTQQNLPVMHSRQPRRQILPGVRIPVPSIPASVKAAFTKASNSKVGKELKELLG